MAFKMNPKSPLLMKAMGVSPAKQSVQGTNQTIQAEGKPEGPALTALQQAQQEANAAQMNNKVAQIRRNTSGTNKETARLKKRTARNNSGTERKTKNAEKTQNRVNERKESGQTRVGKVLSKIKKAVSPAKQTAKQKANLPKEIVKAIGKGAAKAGAKAGAKANKFAKNNSALVTTGKPKSPTKQAKITDAMYKKRDMKLYGELDKAEFDKEANRQINVRNKRFKNATEMSKANSGGKQTKTDYFGGQTKDGSCSREDDACNTKGQSIRKRDIGYDVPKRQMQSKTKKVTTLKAEGVKNKGGGLPVGKPIKAKEIKVTKKVAAAKPTRSQKIRAKGEAALASGNTDKAQRLRRRMDRVDARKAKRAARKAARA